MGTLTLVHILGCHLQAQRLNGDDWEKIVWGNGFRTGRIVQGLLTAIEEDASYLSFGTGASERGGLKESRVMKMHAENNLDDVVYAQNLSSADTRLLEQLLDQAWLDTETQNTTEEVKRLFEYAADEDVEKVIFVTSAFHAPRALAEVVKAYRELYPNGNGPQIAVTPALDDPGLTTVFEEHHRGDMEPVDYPSVLRRMFKFLRVPKLAKELISSIDDEISRHEEKL